MPTSPSATRRRRRIIYNNDGDDLLIPAHGAPISGYPARLDTVQQYLDLRMSALAGTQVDSLFYCGFVIEPNWEFPSQNIADLGPDPVQHVVDFAHRHGMEFFYSMRMNDIHGSVHAGKSYWPPYKREHLHLLQAGMTPEEFAERVLPWINGERRAHPLQDLEKRRGRSSRDYFAWGAYDYAHAEVRAHYLAAILEACRRYDLDGIELDWGRFLFYFKFGEERRYIPLMTDFVRLVRQRLNALGEARGRPILLAMRLPDTPAGALAVGLDGASWVREGLLDLLIAGLGHAPFSVPLAPWVELGQAHDIPVYGCISRGVYPATEPEAVRAIASRYWMEGVDGIYIFNFFDPQEYSFLHEIGDPAQLERRDKLYLVDELRSSAGANLTNWPGQLPLHFTTQSGAARAAVQMQIADDLSAARQVTVLARWDAGLNMRRVSLALNGTPLDQFAPVPPQDQTEGWLACPTRALQRGDNVFQATIHPPAERGDAAEPVTWQALWVKVEY